MMPPLSPPSVKIPPGYRWTPFGVVPDDVTDNDLRRGTMGAMWIVEQLQKARDD